MIPCDDIQARLLLGGTLDEPEVAHVRGCPRCRADEAVVRALASSFAVYIVPDPPAGLSARVLRAAAPALLANARRARTVDWPLVARAVGVALLPLPLILFLDLQVVRAVYALLSTVLPHGFGFYVVVNYAVLLAFLVASTYAAVPFVAARQARPRPEVRYA
jgi:hypothetical protein